MSLIGISGSQGQGKTTVLSTLSELGYNVIPHKTSRLILEQWGMTLNEINKSPDLTKKFQQEILIQHYKNNEMAINSEELFFSERSFADVFTYTLFALGSFNEYSEWLDQYYEQCKELQTIYKSIIVLSGRANNIENDGIRSVNGHFTNCVNIMLDYYIEDFKIPTIRIDSSDHDERIEIIKDYINENNQ